MSYAQMKTYKVDAASITCTSLQMLLLYPETAVIDLMPVFLVLIKIT